MRSGITVGVVLADVADLPFPDRLAQAVRLLERSAFVVLDRRAVQ
jgi:hypothetical protein